MLFLLAHFNTTYRHMKIAIALVVRSVTIEEPSIDLQKEQPTLFVAGGRWQVIHQIIEPLCLRGRWVAIASKI
ncbi:MAG: hypothetical protein F6K40_14580 [Okeania sp. SIO3I5]|uniref:hypothetical protein n=1 Tax=Okeania sp. SIO3I5 TaxID=2607805 RepID=UPI0013B6E37E|nr:hypothetical protein [Okeania sp. SIO3I5]NEQ37424.1 hypothetical protein [Okeania sp. SIO3I5]